MRKLSLFLTLLVLLIGGTMAAIVYLIPSDFYKQKIEEQASTMLGRELRIEGPVSLHLFPTLQARAQNVTLANPPGFSGPDFATMNAMRVSVAILPLLKRRVEIREFILLEPTIILEKRADGAVNWAFGKTDQAKTRAPTNAGFKREPGALPLEASLGNIRLENGDIRILDRVKDTSQHLANVNLDLSMPSLDAAMTAKGELWFNDKTYTLDASLGGLRPFLEGKKTALSLKLDNALFSASFDGAFDESSTIAASGELMLRVPSVRKLAASAGTTLADTPNAYGSFVISGTARANTKRFSFDNAELSFDAITGKGSFGAVFAGAKPKLTGNLDIPSLDLTPYLPVSTPGGQGVSPWSTTTFDLSMLNIVDSRFTLALGALKARKITIGKSVMQTELVNGRLQADLTEMALYDGRGSARVVVNARGEIPSFLLAADITEIEFQPLLIDAIKFRRLAGKGEAKFSLLGKGSSQKAIMDSLSGAGNLKLRDGQIIGINLASVLRSAQSFITSGALPAKTNAIQATDFTDLSASFNVANGIARTDDFIMLSPLIRVPGEGTLDIGGQQVDFRLTPRGVASLEGQGGKADLVGLKVPFRIYGPWNAIKAGIDTKLLKKKAKKKAKKAIGKLLDQNMSGDTGAALKSMLGIQETSPDQTQNLDGTEPKAKTDEEVAVDALIGLFKKKKKKKKQ